MSSRNRPLYRPAAAIEETWWKVAGLERVGELDRVARAADVERRVRAPRRRSCRRSRRGGRSGRRCPRARRSCRRRRRASAARGRRTTRLDAARAAPQPLDQRLELLARALAHEHVDVALAVEQPLDQVAADEAGRAGDEIGRIASPFRVRSKPIRLRRNRPRPSPPAKRAAPAGRRRASRGRLGLEREAVVERQPEALDRGAAVGEHRLLREARRAARPAPARARGGGRRGTTSLTSPMARRLVGVDRAAGEDQVERAAHARRCAAAAACRRRSAARPSGARRSRTSSPRWRCAGRTTAPARGRPARHQPEIAAIVGFDGVSRVKPIGPVGGRDAASKRRRSPSGRRPRRTRRRPRR